MSMGYFFWNSEEQRVRVVWRITVLVVAMFASLLGSVLGPLWVRSRRDRVRLEQGIAEVLEGLDRGVFLDAEER